MPTTPIKAIIVEDMDIFRWSIRTAFETRHTDIEIVDEAKSGEDFFNLLNFVSADLTILDIGLPGMSGIEVARRLKTEQPDMKILVLSSQNTPEVIEELLDTGIDGFVSKQDTGGDTIAEAIRSIMQGNDYFGQDIAGIISRIYIAKKKKMDVTSEFTDVEKRIIELCHEGLSAKLIADRLGNTARTVDWHKSNIFKKLGINSTTEMLRYALQNGIIND